MENEKQSKKIIFFDDYSSLFNFGKVEEEPSCFVEAFNNVFDKSEYKFDFDYYCYADDKDKKIKKYSSETSDCYKGNVINISLMSEVIANLNLDSSCTIFVDYSWVENGKVNDEVDEEKELKEILDALNKKQKGIKVYIYSAKIPMCAKEFSEEHKSEYGNLDLRWTFFNRTDFYSSILYFEQAFIKIRDEK